jgi:hypothetical protein
LDFLKIKEGIFMPVFSQRSRRRLYTCDQRLVQVMETAIREIDLIVLEGHRSPETHNEYIHRGATRVPYSRTRHRHNPSQAVDIAPWITQLNRMADWNDPNELRYFYYMGGFVQATAIRVLGYPLRWGGNWDGDSIIGVGAKSDDQTFNDLVHFELTDEVE